MELRRSHHYTRHDPRCTLDDYDENHFIYGPADLSLSVILALHNVISFSLGTVIHEVTMNMKTRVDISRIDEKYDHW